MFNKPINISCNDEAAGVYVCSSCNTVLFEAAKKFNAGCGFPSFWQHADQNVKVKPLHTYNRNRTQLLCSRCGAHLGHLFGHRHTPTGVRYCVTHDAIRFESCHG